jgi:hypothetical protein
VMAQIVSDYCPMQLKQHIEKVWIESLECSCSKGLVEGWSEPPCQLQHLLFIKVRDNEDEVLRGFKSRYLHPGIDATRGDHFLQSA